ncbi:hypothetical protein GPECTOR_20g418 [Gonium pectorale]|uniref:Uncharacterized protein n=1 Tax=Gonium pectorale TaxID=33097 RepID=A0A150GIB2_GONPE|nr:hypothetical protein GPECTOR_20g418 [Gonium pectorale]|eukprot:KXZ49563.1 hypothetical protein GPECTOR_20g418 [Gonium pectorale]
MSLEVRPKRMGKDCGDDAGELSLSLPLPRVPSGAVPLSDWLHPEDRALAEEACDSDSEAESCDTRTRRAAELPATNSDGHVQAPSLLPDVPQQRQAECARCIWAHAAGAAVATSATAAAVAALAPAGVSPHLAVVEPGAGSQPMPRRKRSQLGDLAVEANDPLIGQLRGGGESSSSDDGSNRSSVTCRPESGPTASDMLLSSASASACRGIPTWVRGPAAAAG